MIVGVHGLALEQHVLAGVALAALVGVDERDPAGQEGEAAQVGFASVTALALVQSVTGMAALDRLRAREVQGRHDVVGGGGDAGVADEVAHGGDADGHQHAGDRQDDHQLQQRETGLGSFHGSHYTERPGGQSGPSDGRSRAATNGKSRVSAALLMSARA